MIKNYLTEKLVGDFLKETFPNGEWIHNNKFMSHSFRPDYQNDYYKLVVEFDGYRPHLLDHRLFH